MLIDTTLASRAPRSGPGVYVTRLCEALAARHDVELITAENPRRSSAGAVRSLASEVWWTTRELPRLARQARADLIHHPVPVRILHEAALPQVVTIHDLAFDRRVPTYTQLAHRSAARSARVLITVSQTTADEARETWGVPAERIVVAHHGPGQALRTGSGAARRGRYFLYVGSQERHKDLTTLLNAYSRYRLAAGGRPADLLLAGSARGAAAPGVWRETDPDAARLAELYAGALALAHPARYEGFGMTVLEAMALRVPVVAARSAAVAETAGDAALLVEPGDAVAMGAALVRLASEPSLRARLSARGRERASGFSWARSAERHVAAYALALT